MSSVSVHENGEPRARLVPLPGGRPMRRAGTLSGTARLMPDFFEPLPSDWRGEAGIVPDIVAPPMLQP